MGVSTSRSASEVYQDVVQKQMQTCPNFSCQNVIGDVEVVADGGNVSGLRITQQCSISGECIFNGLIDSLADVIQKNKSEVTGGIGISVGSAKSIAKTSIKQIQEQKCGNITSENIAGDVSFRAVEGGLYDIRFEQIADLKQRCLFESTSKLISKIESETASKTTGFNPFSIGMGILLIIGVIIVMMFSGGAKGGLGKAIIGILVIVAAALGIDCWWLKMFICKG